jgi:hypothetical protein
MSGSGVLGTTARQKHQLHPARRSFCGPPPSTEALPAGRHREALEARMNEERRSFDRSGKWSASMMAIPGGVRLDLGRLTARGNDIGHGPYSGALNFGIGTRSA